MENYETFKMTYCAEEQEEVARIREKYLPPKEDKLALLRALDAGVTKKATAWSIAVGVVGTLVMGLGMSLVMSEFGTLLGDVSLPVGIAVGTLGIATLATAYPLYQYLIKKERARIAPEILRLTDELTK